MYQNSILVRNWDLFPVLLINEVIPADSKIQLPYFWCFISSYHITWTIALRWYTNISSYIWD